MDTSSTLLALCEGNPLWPVDSPHKGQWHGALMLSKIGDWTNSCANNWDASNLRCNRSHYDVTVMGEHGYITSHWVTGIISYGMLKAYHMTIASPVLTHCRGYNLAVRHRCHKYKCITRQKNAHHFNINLISCHGLLQDCNMSIAIAKKIAQPYTKPSIWTDRYIHKEIWSLFIKIFFS